MGIPENVCLNPFLIREGLSTMYQDTANKHISLNPFLIREGLSTNTLIKSHPENLVLIPF